MPDTFTCSWINRLDQMGFTNMELIITHDQSVIPQARMSFNWKMSPESVDEDFLAQQASDCVERIVTDWNEANAVVEEEII